MFPLQVGRPHVGHVCIYLSMTGVEIYSHTLIYLYVYLCMVYVRCDQVQVFSCM